MLGGVEVPVAFARSVCKDLLALSRVTITDCLFGGMEHGLGLSKSLTGVNMSFISDSR